MSNMKRGALTLALGAAMVVFLAACGSEATEQTQVVSVTPTSIPLTAPLSVPTATPIPTPLPTAAPAATSTPVPTALPAATVAPAATATPIPDQAPEPTTVVADAAPAATAVATPTAAAAAPEIAVPTATVEPAGEDDAADPDPTSTPVPETPTAVVVASGEPPLECFDPDLQIYRAFVDGVDSLSFDGGKVTCIGAATNAVSAARSYRHSSGLIVQRAANYIFNDTGTGYIPFSGLMHFCVNSQPVAAPIVAESVPALLFVIDAEAQRQLAQGASGPALFTSNGTQC